MQLILQLLTHVLWDIDVLVMARLIISWCVTESYSSQCMDVVCWCFERHNDIPTEALTLQGKVQITSFRPRGGQSGNLTITRSCCAEMVIRDRLQQWEKERYLPATKDLIYYCVCIIFIHLSSIHTIYSVCFSAAPQRNIPADPQRKEAHCMKIFPSGTITT
jgi:hypothetical protein